MIGFSIEEIARVTGGVLDQVGHPAQVVAGPVVIDSRQAVPGAVFAALPGERADGHDFAGQAVAAGAALVIGTRPTGVPSVLVADVPAALAKLARAVVDQLPDLTIAAITGSAGKTTTKDLLAQLTSTLGPTVSPQNSFNNEIGHPLTVLRADEDTRYLIAELSARGRGHIAALCRISPPRLDVALRLSGAHNVTNALAAAAVAAELGMSVDAIAAGLSDAVARSHWRMEVTERADGVIVVNDAYNSSPEALAAALAALGVMASGRRAYAVLGRMAELSEPGFTGELVAVPDDQSAVAAITQRLRPGDVVLVKASRAAGLQTVALALLDVLAGGDDPPGPSAVEATP